MNTNEATMAAMPSMNERNKRVVKPQNDHMAAKVAAGAVAGVAVAGAAAGVAYAMNSSDAEETPEDQLHVEDNASSEGHNESQEVHVHHHYAQNVSHEAPAKPASVAVDNGSDDGDPDVHFVGINVTDLDEDGNYEISGVMTIDGHEVAVIDLDVDGIFDVAVADFNNNNVIEEDEIIDISESGMRVGEFYAEVADENPEAAEHFMAQVDAISEGEDPVLVSADIDDLDDGIITVGLADEDDDVMVNVINSDEDVDGEFVAVAQYDDGYDGFDDAEVANDELYADSNDSAESSDAPEPDYEADVHWTSDDLSADAGLDSADDIAMDVVDC